MADVRTLLARLNPTTIRYDVGRGGVAELTNIDIAGALGFVTDKLGREIMCYCYWPDGAALTAHELDAMLAEQMRGEMARLRAARQRADLDLHIAQENMEARRNPSRHDRQALAQCQRDAEAAKEADWPTGPAVYVRIRRAVLAELRDRNHCNACGGRGWTMPEKLVIRCEACAGLGVIPVSGAARARAIGVAQSNYVRTWHRPYEWALSLVGTRCDLAVWQLRRALSREDVA